MSKEAGVGGKVSGEVGCVAPHPSPLTPHALRGALCFNEPMSRHVSWRAGGAAERCYTPADLDDLAAFLRDCPADEPVYFVGLGSNLLVRDGGMRGTVILTHGALNRIGLEGRDADCIYAEAGVPSAKVARFAAAHDLQGAEFLAGIPGTVGGALAMNAGCHGAETWQIVAEVQTIDRSGTLRRRGPEDYDIAYRHVALLERGEELGVRSEASGSNGVTPHSSPLTPYSEEWFVAAWFKLQKGLGEVSRQRIKELLAKRGASQPLNLPNAGSVFRNPPGDYAARLIESCGLKGFAIGGAQVSEKHANFIVNTGDAKAADIEALIERVRATVKEQCGVELMPEVRIVGEQ